MDCSLQFSPEARHMPASPYVARLRGASGVREVFGVALQCAGPAALVRIARSKGVEPAVLQPQPGPCSEVFEGQGHQGFGADAAVGGLVDVGEHEPFRCNDLTVDAALDVLDAVRGTHAAK